MPEPRGRGNAVPSGEVRSMFDRIAPVYDAMNTVMTAGMDARWRRAAAAATRVGPAMSAIDVACGTGALTRELARRVGPAGRIVGVDASAGMLERARPGRVAWIEYVLADALALPGDDAAFDAATIAFGLRNVPDYERCLAEMVRVTRPGGRIVVLELATPTGLVGRALAATWFERIVPTLGRAAGRADAYRYLPHSVRSFPRPDAVAELMRAAGLRDVRWRRLAPGLVTLHAGRVG
jgi:demethylmenaquinone methyltransferase / 2-methoxy-6-polyprenyl-1,4-benzoquinol methylase